MPQTLPQPGPTSRPRGQRKLKVTLTINDVPYVLLTKRNAGGTIQSMSLLKKDAAGNTVDRYEITGYNPLTCNCRGFEKFGFCKHVDSLRKLVHDFNEYFLTFHEQEMREEQLHDAARGR